jgi:hypothetical protein
MHLAEDLEEKASEKVDQIKKKTNDLVINVQVKAKGQYFFNDIRLVIYVIS